MIPACFHRNDRRRAGGRGFTLVELLVVVALMSVLTGMMSIALSSARQDSRIRRARAEVQTISVILQQKLNDINLAPVSLIGSTVNAFDGIEQNRVTMLARRDLMRMKMPQCRADLIYPPARLQFVRNASAPTPTGAVKIEQPSEWAQMRRIAGFGFPTGVEVENTAALPLSFRVFSNAFIDPITTYFGTSPQSNTLRTRLGQIRDPSDPVNFDLIDLEDVTSTPWPEARRPRAGEVWTRDFESAECLYLILSTTEIFGQRAIDQFSARSIGNLDGDAIPEIIDPWGNPYEFIRDPVGRRFRANQTTVLPTKTHPDGPDPADYLRTDFRFINNANTNPPTMLDDPFKISPLVISAGPDGEFGLRRSFDRSGDPLTDRMGVSPRYSTGATQLTALNFLPARVSPTAPPVPPPTLPGGAYQYPDPYAQMRASTTAPYLSGADNTSIRADNLTDATLFSWHGNGTQHAVGLGAALLTANNTLEETFADNIASDDPE